MVNRKSIDMTIRSSVLFGKAILAVVTLLTIAALGSAVQPGKWEVTGVGQSLSVVDEAIPALMAYGFYVSDGGKLLIPDEQFVVIDSCCAPFAHFIRDDISTTRISEGRFSFADGFLLFEGAFDSDTTAHGTWSLERLVMPEKGPPIHLSQGNWIASYTGTATMVSPAGKLSTTWGRIKSTRY